MDERRDKTMEEELKEIRKTALLWFIIFCTFAILLFPFSLTLFQKIYSDLVPANIKILVTNPLNLFFIQIKVSAFFAFLFSLPFLLYRIVRYLSPALYVHERKIIKGFILPSVLLFTLGGLFAYFLLVPLTLKILNSYVLGLSSAETYFEINQFVTFALFAIFLSGISFILPVFMRTLSLLGLVNPKTWMKNFKYSLIAIVILSAIITPDGTGITMLMLSIPLVSLYLAGYALSKGVSYGN